MKRDRKRITDVVQPLWIVDVNGDTHPYDGTPSDALTWAKRQGIDYAYAAPYGYFVQSEDENGNTVQLHDFIREGRKERQIR